MVTCSQCGVAMPDILDGDTSSDLVRELLAQCKERERCALCLESYKKTAALCRDAVRNESADKPDDARLLAVLRDKLKR